MSQLLEPRTTRRHSVALMFALALLGSTGPRCWASGGHAAAEAPAEETDDEVSEESDSGYRGIKLGEFKIRTTNSVLLRKDGVAFIMHATVKNENYGTFERLYRHRKHKVRDQVVVATRLVPIEDYDDPELKKFRRRILLRLRRTIPELPIDDVYISDFALSSEST